MSTLVKVDSLNRITYVVGRMGGYVSVPFTSKKVVHVEPSKPVVAQEFEDIAKIMDSPTGDQKAQVSQETEVVESAHMAQVEPVVTKVVEEVNVSVPSEQPEIVSFPPPKLSIMIPQEEYTTKNHVTPKQEEIADEPVAERIPEFTGNMNSVSHAVKKFNRRHRKK